MGIGLSRSRCAFRCWTAARVREVRCAVFQTRRGLSPVRRNVLRAVQTAGDNAGLNPDGAKPVGLHDLRHSAAGVVFEALPLNQVSRLLRHANPRVTASVYGVISDDAAAAL